MLTVERYSGGGEIQAEGPDTIDPVGHGQHAG